MLKGQTITEEQRERMKAGQKRRFQDPEQRERLANVHRGKSLTEKHKANISNALKGVTIWNKGLTKEDDDRIRLMSQKAGNTMRGRPRSDRGKPHKIRKDKPCYSSLLQWVKKWKTPSDVCQICGTTNTRITLMNKYHQYSRNLDDYMWACSSCWSKNRRKSKRTDYSVSEETRLKISENTKKAMQNPEIRQKYLEANQEKVMRRYYSINPHHVLVIIKPPQFKKRRQWRRGLAKFWGSFTHFPKGHISHNKGKKCPAVTGDNNVWWKGENVSPVGISKWAIRQKGGKARECSYCGKTGDYIQWANKGNKGSRNIDDYMALCPSCRIIHIQPLENHSHYKDGTHIPLYDRKFLCEFRKLIKQADNNLITLCRSCHSKTNFNRDYWQNHFTKPKEVLSHAS